jgi:ATP-dependent RNA helicase RhlE
VFVRTKHGADRLAKRLRNDGFRAGELHGGMSQPQRERALGKFASGANDVLVATDVAARGLDLDDITHVINFDPPGDEKDYIHRVGRTARAGRGGEGITFVTQTDWADVRVIANKLDLHVEFAGAGARPAALRAVPSGARRPRQQGNGRARGATRTQGQRRH